MRLYKQETDYTCGCACVRMIIGHFETEEDVPYEMDLEKVLDTNDRQGTDPKTIVEYLQKRGYDVVIKDESNIEEVDSYHRDGWAVMLIISVDAPHYTMYAGNNGNHIDFLDPYFGVVHHRIKKFVSEKTNHPSYRWKLNPKEFKKLYEMGYSFDDKKSNRCFIAAKIKTK